MDDARSPQQEAEKAPYLMWVLHCPYRKTGSPVVGTMGSSIRKVVLMDMEDWKRLCADVPQLATTPFKVGTYE